ncbi:MAG TPA: bifunctional nuclease family protein [Anaerolineaceae bacterium]|nr:bifunctional nuclease family protein [Anaerolineaceae bacterium]HPN53739.1 bifunctional nuclease family protein [Anaerolineaceae bacterium]
MSRMVEMVIDSVRVSLTNQQRIVVLREQGVERYLPIWVGPYEAEAITIALQEIEVSRPQTHDLLKNVLVALNARLLRVEVISLRDDVFYGNLVVDVNGSVIEIDTRPSDALALAARTHVPILVAREVLDTAGIVPDSGEEESEEEEEAVDEDESASLPERPIQKEPDENRLSVFEDFLQGLDLGGDDESTPPDDDDEDPKKGKYKDKNKPR